MTAGQPDWQKLAQMGKLPEHARNRVPGLSALDDANRRIKKLEEENVELKRQMNSIEETKSDKVIDENKNADVDFKIACEVEGCDYIAKGKSEAQARNIALRLHMRMHESKTEDKTNE